MQNNTNISVLKITNDFKSNKASKYPIKNHPLGDFDEHVRNVYFTVLCIITNYNNVISDEQELFIKRILTGISSDYDISYYQKQAIDIDDDFSNEFVYILNTSYLKYNFVVDSLITLGLSKPQNNEQIEFISLLCEILAITVSEVSLCSKIAKAIIEQSAAQIIEISKLPNNMIDHFICYIKEFHQGCLSYNKDLIYCYNDKVEKLPFSSLYILSKEAETEYKSIGKSSQVFLEGKNISFEQELQNKLSNNMYFRATKVILDNYKIESEDLSLIFDDCDEIEILNCDFTKINKIPFVFNKCKNIKIQNCEFKSLECKAIFVSFCDTLDIKNCNFENCNSFRLIDFKDTDKVFINNCNFKKIEFRQLSEAILTIDEWPSTLSISKNLFKDCKNNSGFGTLLISSQAKIRKNDNIMIDDNQFINVQCSNILSCSYLKPIHFKNNSIDNDVLLMS